MSNAREQILGKVRQGLGREGLSEQQCAALEQRNSQPENYIRPQFEGDLVGRFSQQLEAVAGSFERVSDKSQVSKAISQHLDKLSVAHSVVAAPSLQGEGLLQGLEVRYGGTQGDDLVCVTGCFLAVAETGSVVMLSSKESPTGLNFLPDYHIAIVEAPQLVRHIEDVWPLLRQHPNGIPRAVNFISGPSKTADVEQTLQIGAHGPRSFHVIFIDGE